MLPRCSRRFVSLIHRLYVAWVRASLGDTAAALTYYGLLSVFPGLLFVVALFGLVLDPASMPTVVEAVGHVAPRMFTDLVRARLVAIQQTSSARLLVLAFVGTVAGTTMAVETLMQALNRCYEARETRGFWRRWGLAVVTTVLAGVTLMLAVAVTFVGPVIAAHVGGRFAVAARWARIPVAALLATTLWAFVYWALPNVERRFRLFTPGAVIGSLLWLGASYALNAYVRQSRTYEVTYGALGGVIMVLLWMWLSAASILVGAAINQIVGDRPLARRDCAPADEVHRDEMVTPR